MIKRVPGTQEALMRHSPLPTVLRPAQDLPQGGGGIALWLIIRKRSINIPDIKK